MVAYIMQIVTVIVGVIARIATVIAMVSPIARTAAQTTLDATNAKRQHRTDAGVVVEEPSRLFSRSDYFRSGRLQKFSNPVCGHSTEPN
jgi:hypothetical protein